jgi:hypothetical protein
MIWGRNVGIALRRRRNADHLSAFLLSLASLDGNKGRDPSIIVEAMPCSLVAESLSMSVDMLPASLLALEQGGLIEPHLPRGVHIKDFAALEAIAVGQEPRSDTGPLAGLID